MWLRILPCVLGVALLALACTSGPSGTTSGTTSTTASGGTTGAASGGGTSGIDCSTGLSACQGICIALDADASNCGGCLRSCGAGYLCDAGSCWSESTPTPGGSMATGGSSGGSSGSAIPITACTVISAPGAYQLQNDLAAGSQPCLGIVNTNGISLDCAGHAVGYGVAVSDVTSFQIVNCVFENVVESSIVDSADGSLGSSSFGPPGAYVGATLSVVGSSGIAVTDNSFAMAGDGGSSAAAAALLLQGGGGNLVSGNTIVGSWDGGPSRNGTDDGILVEDEVNDVITGNAISEVFDTGIEELGTLSGITFSLNQISMTGFSGIGGWYASSVESCTFSHNDVQQSPTLFAFFRDCGLQTDSPSVTFENNLFDGNTFSNPSFVDSTGAEACTGAPGAAEIPLFDQMDYTPLSDADAQCDPANTPASSTDFVLMGNVFSDNDFGHTCLPPFFGYQSPIVGEVVDSGGNRCSPAPSYYSQPYPLSCL